MGARVTHLSPDGLHRNPYYSQAVAVQGNVKTIYVGGQNAVLADGSVVGVGDLRAQTEQVYKNLETVLKAAGGTLHDIVKWSIFVVQGQDILPSLGLFQQVWGQAPPPAITVTFVAGLAHPDFLVEIEAIAVIDAAGEDDHGR